MSMVTMLTGPQLAALDQCRSIRNELVAQTFASILILLITRGNFDLQPWLDEVDALIKSMYDAMISRDSSATSVQTEAKQIGVNVEAIRLWLAESERVSGQAMRKKIAGADVLYDQLAHLTEDSARQLDFLLRKGLSALVKVPDVKVFGFEEGFVARGEKMLEQLNNNRAEQDGAHVGISVSADVVHATLLRLAELMEQLNDAREVAQLRVGRELPGFDLRLIRAAVAGNAPQTSANAAPAVARANGL